MSDSVVSVRMPRSLAIELKRLAGENHYLDVSEELRSLLRERWMQYRDPYTTQLKDIKKKMKVSSNLNALKTDLKKLLEELENAE